MRRSANVAIAESETETWGTKVLIFGSKLVLSIRGGVGGVGHGEVSASIIWKNSLPGISESVE